MNKRRCKRDVMHIPLRQRETAQTGEDDVAMCCESLSSFKVCFEPNAPAKVSLMIWVWGGGAVRRVLKRFPTSPTNAYDCFYFQLG